jgi:ribosomal protein S6--L-glutamate ligase
MLMAISHSCHGHPPPAGSADGRRPRIAIAMERRYLAQPQPAGLAVALAIAGHAPILLDPETSGGACLREMDLLVVRGRSPALLDLLELAESLEVPVVNRRSAIASVLDKARMARALATAGLPVPATRVGTLRALADRSSASDFPMVVKPVRGDNARDVHVVRTRGELLALRFGEAVALAQPFIPSDGFDLKLYVAGSDVVAVRKPSPIVAERGAPGQPVRVTPALRDLALRCRLLFGLEIFGVDCVETPDGPVVIEVNDFPNYSGVEDADARLARQVLARAWGVARSRNGR